MATCEVGRLQTAQDLALETSQRALSRRLLAHAPPALHVQPLCTALPDAPAGHCTGKQQLSVLEPMELSALGRKPAGHS